MAKKRHTLELVDRHSTAVRKPRKIGHVPIPGGQIVNAELVQMGMAAGSGEHAHEFDSGLQVVLQPPGRLVDHEPRP